MDHAGRVLTGRGEQLSRVARAFAVRGNMLDIRMLALSREKHEIVEAIAAIRASLDSPAVQKLSMHVQVIARIAALEQRASAVGDQIAALQQDMIAARSKERHAGELSARIAETELRKSAEAEMLETLTAMRASSLPQAGDD